MSTPFLFPIEPDEFFRKLSQTIEHTLEKHSTQLSPTPEGLTTNPLLSLKDVCKLFQISKPTVYDWIEHKKLKPYKIRGRVYFLQTDINLLLQPAASAN